MRNNLTRSLLSFLFIFLFYFDLGQKNDAAKLIREGNHLIFKDPAKAKQIAKKLYDDANENSPQKINALLILAQADALLANYESSLQYALEAKDLSEKLSDQSYKIRIYAYLGYHYQRLNIQDKAWKYIDEAEQTIKTKPLPDSLSYLKGNLFFTKASMYQKELDCAYAINYFDQAIKAYHESIKNEYSNTNLGLAYSQKGYCELEINQLTEAESSLKLAISNSEKNSDVRNNIFAVTGLARVDTLHGNYARSNKVLLQQLRRAKEGNLKHLLNDIYKFLAYNYLKLKDTKNYELYDQLYKKSQLEFSKTEAGSINHIIKDASKNKQEKIYSKSLIAGIIVIIILLLSIIFIVLRIKNMKKRMKDQ
ncbi:hypothetical protein NG800_006085 [Epilithonimonas ginsengisoli]|uniref:Tetratricopeptide repeat protein n=1 Tax=Epilithonimonas ginsengisoli TaxID=1245592 RepID=A0ABU4JFR8_9FLAO|nr:MULTISPECIES: hypothetical protein [Chryseobacterium group]MBV6879829.1 hypothetical protein [Epilithonimonas sp. FP105]MDW8548469.1 hypothetical protein [Epilithonimonas ginsengisoli]OAH75740.1 hypothetical protein AXA65_02675 [Chryseobacterium sp. FP211-J200]